MVYTFDFNTWEAETEDRCEFQAILFYMVSSGLLQTIKKTPISIILIYIYCLCWDKSS